MIDRKLVINWMLACAVVACANPTFAQEAECSIAKWYGNKKAALTMTFDDGLKEHYTIVYPELKQRGLSGTFFIIGSKVGKEHKGTPCCTWQELKKMSDGGMEIGSHGYRHLNVEKLSEAELRYEVGHNDTIIYAHIGRSPLTYCYPGNRITETAKAIVCENHIGARETQVSVGSTRDSLWLARWLRRGIRNREWLIGMTHGITQGYDSFADSGKVWRQHLDDIVSLRDDLWVATLADVTAYQKLRDATTLTSTRMKNGELRISATTTCKDYYQMPLTIIIKGNYTYARQGNRPIDIRHAGDTTVIDIDILKEYIVLK